MRIDVNGTVALVTGANRGIGKAITASLLKHGASKVYAAVRNPDSAAALVDVHGERVVPLRFDLVERGTIIAAAQTAADVEIVVNNAGILRTGSPLEDGAIDALAEQIEVNVYGLIRTARAFAPVLKRNGGGAFVQLNSIASLRTFPPFATYCASKAAAYSVTQALHAVLAEQGTHVLSVHPGPIATDMAEDAGIMDMADPPEVVGEGIVEALRRGDYHLFPDSTAREVGAAYRSFAEDVVEAVAAGTS